MCNVQLAWLVTRTVDIPDIKGVLEAGSVHAGVSACAIWDYACAVAGITAIRHDDGVQVFSCIFRWGKILS